MKETLKDACDNNVTFQRKRILNGILRGINKTLQWKRFRSSNVTSQRKTILNVCKVLAL